MAKLPKIPKGLKRSVTKLRAKDRANKKRAARLKEIADLKREQASLKKKLYGY